jgi:hypothetical protein
VILCILCEEFDGVEVVSGAMIAGPKRLDPIEGYREHPQLAGTLRADVNRRIPKFARTAQDICCLQTSCLVLAS